MRLLDESEKMMVGWHFWFSHLYEADFASEPASSWEFVHLGNILLVSNHNGYQEADGIVS